MLNRVMFHQLDFNSKRKGQITLILHQLVDDYIQRIN